MTNNLELWDKVKRPPEDALKAFTRGGGFKGTAIKPMWSIHVMTEQFGPCGQGWGINEPHFSVHPVGNEILVYCTVSVWHTKRENMVFGVGGDKVLVSQSNGLRSDDEAFKKAFTDAITNALKHLGVGADIHMGLWDGSKYADEDAPDTKPKQSYDRNPIVKAEFERINKGINTIGQTGNIEDLTAWYKNNVKSIEGMPADWNVLIMDNFSETKEQLKAKAA